MNGDFSLVDGAVGLVLVVAILRGLAIGLIRETFSMAALGAAVLAARYGAPPLGAWLTQVTGGETGPVPPNWIAGTVLAVIAAFAVGGLGYLIRRGVKLVGLSWADRIGGGALGALEGLVIGLLIVMGLSFFFGRNHPSIRDSATLTIYDELRQYADQHGASLPSVASPGRP